MAANSIINIVIKATDKASAKVNRTSGTLNKLKIGIAGVAAAGAAAAGAAGIAALKMANDFEASFAAVRTLLPEMSEEGFRRLEQDVIRLSKETGIATDKVIPALYQAISAGVPPENVMDFLATSARASIGGLTDLETSVDGITSVVNSYGKEVIDAAQASDVMFTAVRLGKTDFNQLSNSLFNVVPTAATLGVNFQEIGAQLAVITAQGVPTTVATTQLRQAFVEASKGGSTLDKTIRQIHGESFQGLIKQGMGATEILQSVRTWAERNGQSFNDLFGSVEGMNAALALTGPNFARVQDALEQTQDSGGAVNTAFETVANTGRFKFNQAVNSMKTRLLELGMRLMPLATRVTEIATEAIDRFGAWWSENGADVQDIVRTLGDAINFAFGILQTFWELVKPHLESFKLWLDENLPRFRTQWAELAGQVSKTIEALTKTPEGTKEADRAFSLTATLVGFLRGVIGGFAEGVGRSLDAVAKAWGFVARAATIALTIITPILDFFGIRLDGIAGIFETLGRTFGKTLARIFFPIGMMLANVTGWIEGIVGGIQKLGAIWSIIWSTIGSVTSTIWGFIRDNIFGPIGRFFTQTIPGWLDVVSGAWTGTWGFIRDNFSTIWDAIKDTAKVGVNFLIAGINAVIQAWNDLEFRVPSVTVLGKTFGGQVLRTPNLPTIPHFATGGVVDNVARGMATPAIVHGGEGIFTPEQMDALGGAGGSTVVVNINAPVFGVDDLDDRIAASVADGIRRGRFGRSLNVARLP